MDFEELLRRAQRYDLNAQKEILRMYRPLLMKNSMVDRNVIDEDLYQELSVVLLNCIEKFRF